jgi:hypothetical protein
MIDAEKRESFSNSEDSGTNKAKLKRGRPRAENPLAVNIKVRLTAEQARKLDAYCKRHNTRRALAVRDAVLELIEKR